MKGLIERLKYAVHKRMLSPRNGPVSMSLADAQEAINALESMPVWVKCEEGLREIIEIYAGMEGFKPETAPEAYLQRIVKQMADAAVDALPAPPIVEQEG